MSKFKEMHCITCDEDADGICESCEAPLCYDCDSCRFYDVMECKDTEACAKRIEEKTKA